MAIVHQGTLHKLGGNVKSWTKRWMILKSDNVLYYYKDPAKAPQGSIPLKDHMFRVKGGAERDLNWPKAIPIDRTVVVRTSYRVFYMYAESKNDAEEWIRQLQSASDNLPNRVKSRSFSKSASLSASTIESSVEQSVVLGEQPKGVSSSAITGNGAQFDRIYDDPSVNGDSDDSDSVYELTDAPKNYKAQKSPNLLMPQSILKNSDESTPKVDGIYDDVAPDTKVGNPDELVYEEVKEKQSYWPRKKSPPPAVPSDEDDDEDEDTVQLPPPMLPPKDKKSHESAEIETADEVTEKNESSNEMLTKDEDALPPSSELMQKPKIESGYSFVSVHEVNFEPEESSEDFYVEMDLPKESRASSEQIQSDPNLDIDSDKRLDGNQPAVEDKHVSFKVEPEATNSTEQDGNQPAIEDKQHVSFNVEPEATISNAANLDSTTGDNESESSFEKKKET